MMEGLDDFEQAVLDKLLSGPHAFLAILRAQAEEARLVDRELTGVGFFCSFEVPSEVPIVEGRRNFEIDDVGADVQGLVHGAGFVLFIRDGRMDTLEGFSYGEPWPRKIRQFTLRYLSEPRELSLPEASP